MGQNRATLKANGIRVDLAARGMEDYEEDDSLDSEVRRSHGEVVEKKLLKVRGATSLYFEEPYCESPGTRLWWHWTS